MLLAEILLGVLLPRVALPPEMLKLKSLASSEPLPPLVLYTASLSVIETVLLFEARLIAEKSGTEPS